MKTRGQQAIQWIEEYCRVPLGAARGRTTRLSTAQRDIILQIYDGAQNIPVTETASWPRFLHWFISAAPKRSKTAIFIPRLLPIASRCGTRRQVQNCAVS
jgi:hypothetical protein